MFQSPVGLILLPGEGHLFCPRSLIVDQTCGPDFPLLFLTSAHSLSVRLSISTERLIFVQYFDSVMNAFENGILAISQKDRFFRRFVRQARDYEPLRQVSIRIV
jgi:hypothetical protein